MSSFEHTRQNVTQALRNLQAEGPSFQVQRVTPIGDKFARILGTITASASPEAVRNAVAKLNNKVVPVEGSVAAIASNGITQTVEGIVGVLEQRVVLDESNAGGFTAIANTNMYMDSEERLWSLNKTDAGDILIKSHAGDDMEIMQNLMACVASNSVGIQESIPASDRVANQRSSLQGGDLMAYVSPTLGRTVMGFAVASVVTGEGADTGLLAVIDRDGNVEQIDRQLVVASVASNDIEFDDTTEMEAVAAGNFSLEFIADYYRKMFIRSPEYFDKFWARFKSHAFM